MPKNPALKRFLKLLASIKFEIVNFLIKLFFYQRERLKFPTFPVI